MKNLINKFFSEDQETVPLNVECFELMGFSRNQKNFLWSDPQGVIVFALTPLIHENFQLTLEWLMPFMKEAGYEPDVTNTDPGAYFTWDFVLDGEGVDCAPKLITDPSNWAKPACLSAIPNLKKIKEEKKK